MRSAAASTTQRDRPEIGFDRVLKLAWVDRALALLAQGSPPTEVRELLRDVIAAEVSGADAAQKTVCVLSGLWLTPPGDLVGLRDRAVELRRWGTTDTPLVFHWGMALAGYPLFRKVAEAAGRLLRLQGLCSASQVQRRLQEQLGERQIVSRATRHVLRTLVAWGALNDTHERGLYEPAGARSVDDSSLAAWLIEAALRAETSGRARFSGLIRSPALFPFDVSNTRVADLAASDSLEVHREGLREEVVAIA